MTYSCAAARISTDLSVRRDPHVRRVVILSAGNEWDEDAVRLAEKYGNVSFYNTTER